MAFRGPLSGIKQTLLHSSNGILSSTHQNAMPSRDSLCLPDLIRNSGKRLVSWVTSKFVSLYYGPFASCTHRVRVQIYLTIVAMMSYFISRVLYKRFVFTSVWIGFKANYYFGKSRAYSVLANTRGKHTNVIHEHAMLLLLK